MYQHTWSELGPTVQSLPCRASPHRIKRKRRRRHMNLTLQHRMMRIAAVMTICLSVCSSFAAAFAPAALPCKNLRFVLDRGCTPARLSQKGVITHMQAVGDGPSDRVPSRVRRNILQACDPFPTSLPGLRIVTCYRNRGYCNSEASVATSVFMCRHSKWL